MILQIVILIFCRNFPLSVAWQGLFLPSTINNDINIYNFQIDNIFNENLIPVSIIQRQLEELFGDKSVQKRLTKKLNLSKMDLSSAIKTMDFYR